MEMPYWPEAPAPDAIAVLVPDSPLVIAPVVVGEAAQFWSAPEVTIEGLHKHGANNPIDECERVCRGEIVSRLREIGVCEGAWAGGGS